MSPFTDINMKYASHIAECSAVTCAEVMQNPSFRPRKLDSSGDFKHQSRTRRLAFYVYGSNGSRPIPVDCYSATFWPMVVSFVFYTL